MHIVGFSCKSRFCSSCGKIYAENWALNLKEQLFDVQHIHAVFSLPTGFCRDFFFSHRFKLQDLAKAAYQSLKYVFKKSGIHSLELLLIFIHFQEILIGILIFIVFLLMVDIKK